MNRRIPPTILATLLLLFEAVSGSVRANELFEAAPIDEVSIRALPVFTVIETDTMGSLDTAWTKGFRLGARYAAFAHSSLNTPSLIIFPDWDNNPTAEGSHLHLLVQLLLDPLPDLPKDPNHEAALEQMPAMTVACYAQRGAYSPANFALGLKKIQEHLQARNIRAVGPPRYLYYTNTSWIPSWWRVSEVQVPIAAGSEQN